MGVLVRKCKQLHTSQLLYHSLRWGLYITPNHIGYTGIPSHSRQSRCVGWGDEGEPRCSFVTPKPLTSQITHHLSPHPSLLSRAECAPPPLLQHPHPFNQKRTSNKIQRFLLHFHPQPFIADRKIGDKKLLYDFRPMTL